MLPIVRIPDQTTAATNRLAIYFLLRPHSSQHPKPQTNTSFPPPTRPLTKPPTKLLPKAKRMDHMTKRTAINTPSNQSPAPVARISSGRCALERLMGFLSWVEWLVGFYLDVCFYYWMGRWACFVLLWFCCESGSPLLAVAIPY